MEISWICRKDIPRVLQIDRAACKCAWTEADLMDVLRQRNVVAMCAVRDEELVGFMVYELHPECLNVRRFAVDPPAQRQGVGAAMFRELVNKLFRQNRTSIVLVIRDDQDAACLFLRAVGALAENVIQDYWHDGSDAYVFVFYKVEVEVEAET